MKEEIKDIHGNKWKWKHNGPKPSGGSKICPQREVCSNTGLPEEAKKLKKTPTFNLTPKGAKKKNNNKRILNPQEEGNHKD